MKITTITPEQIARFPEWTQKYIELGLSTSPADFADGFVSAGEKVGEVLKSVALGLVFAKNAVDTFADVIELYGADRYLLASGAAIVSRDEAGILYRKEISDDEPLVMVRVLNPTAEPDGVLTRDEAIQLFGNAAHRITNAAPDARFKEYFLRVSPECRPLLADGTQGKPQKLTARNAVAASYGLRGDEYDESNGVLRT